MLGQFALAMGAHLKCLQLHRRDISKIVAFVEFPDRIHGACL